MRNLLATSGRIGVGVAFAALALAAARPVLARDPGQWSSIRGKASLAEAATLPPGASLRLTLQDLTLGSRKAATVATAAIPAKGELPIPFELEYNENLIEASHLYGLAGAITDPGGRVLWETRVPIRVVTLGNPRKADLVLRPPAVKTPPPNEPTAFEVDCEGFRFDVRLDGDVATVRLPDRELVLRKIPTSYGKKFSDGASTLAVAGETVAAYFGAAGGNYRSCRIAHEHEREGK